MRGAMLAGVAVMAVACGGVGRKAEPEPDPAPVMQKPAAQPEPKKADPEPPPTPPKKGIETVGPIGFGEIQNTYKENEIAADAKWRGKRVIVNISEIVKIGREEGKGRPYIATHSFGHNPEPTGYFFFAEGQEADLAKLKRGIQNPPLRVTGGCAGKKDDGINRGIKGFEFVVMFVDTKLTPR